MRYYVRSEIERFLRAVDRALERRATIILIGGSAAAVKYRITDPTADIDTFNALGVDLKRAIAAARKEAIRRALGALGAALPNAGAPRELWVVGGAALVLLYDARETTKGVDAFTLDAAGSAELRAAAASVAARLGLPEDWLNDGAKAISTGSRRASSSSALRTCSFARSQLLAMKLSAWRDDLDVADARLLLSRLSGDRASVWSQVEPHLVPGRELKTQYAFDDLWEVDRGPA